MMKLDDIKKLHQRKYRQQWGYCLLEGEHLVDELYRASRTNAGLLKSQLLVTENSLETVSDKLLQQFDYQVISEKRFKQIADTPTPQGIIAVCPMTALQHQNPKALPKKDIYLYEIQDPGNLGTIIRTLAWFGGFRLLLSPNSVDPFNSKVLRSSMGAIFHTPIELDVSLATLQQRYSKIALLDMAGKAISDASFNEFDCYVFGNEARGVPKELLIHDKTTAFTIPGTGAIESLNLGTSVSLCAFTLHSDVGN